MVLSRAATRDGSDLERATSFKAGSRQSDAYLSELLSYSLDRLRKEPELLRDEKQQIERSIQNTSVSNHGAFIETAECLGTINTELTSVCEKLDLLLQDIPGLASSCEAFSSRSSAVLEQYSQNKALAGSQSALLEVLEVPALMDTCVRNGIYDEALDLQAFVHRMGLLHPDIPAVRMLMQQVNEVGQTMLEQLLSRLRSSLQLPECLRTMGYLRRIAVFSEAELRLQFLRCRDEWLSSLVDDLDESDSYEYLKHLTDVYRLHMFDVIMQYRSIFFDTPAAGAGSGAASTASSQADLGKLPGAGSSGAFGSGAGPAVRETNVLYSWVQYRVQHYVRALHCHLPQIPEGGNLASVLEHCMYCGTSLARVGLDVSALLHPLFEQCSLRLFAAGLAGAVDAFNTRLETHKWVALPTPVLQKARQQEQARATAAAAAAAGTTGEDGAGTAGEALASQSSTAAGAGSAQQPAAPPYTIMEHLPLAILTNAVLAALNELRHCAMLSVARPAAGMLQECVEHVAASLLHYLHTRALADSERSLFCATVKAMLDVVVPYLSSCFSRVFPGGVVKLDLSSGTALLMQALQEA